MRKAEDFKAANILGENLKILELKLSYTVWLLVSLGQNFTINRTFNRNLAVGFLIKCSWFLKF